MKNLYSGQQESAQKNFKNLVLSRQEYHILEIANQDAFFFLLEIRIICRKAETAIRQLFSYGGDETGQYCRKHYWEFEELLLLKAEEGVEKFTDNQPFYRVGFERQGNKWKVWCHVTAEYDDRRSCGEFGKLTNVNPLELINLVIEDIEAKNAKFLAECAEIDERYGGSFDGEE